MERRDNRRFPKRLGLRFTKRGESQAHQGFTTNISVSGMFIGTAVGMSRGDRLRIEIVDRQNGFIVEGQVARVERVPLALRQVRQPGVGIRFLSVGELFQELFPSATISPARDLSQAPAPAAEPEPVERAPAASQDPGDGVVRVRLSTLREVAQVVEHDLAHGGLFIQTPWPLPEGSEVEVVIEVPIPGFRPPRAPARVVHRFEAPSAPGEGSNLLSGMGVVFEDCGPVVDALRDLLRRYQD